MNSQKNQRRSRQRQVGLEELRKLQNHPTAAVLYDTVRRRIPKISLGTVYRNLELMARMGQIQKLDMAGGECRFDGCVERHYHLRCLNCGRVDDISAPPLDLSDFEANHSSGYQLLGHRLEFVGICPKCRSQTQNSNPTGTDAVSASPAIAAKPR